MPEERKKKIKWYLYKYKSIYIKTILKNFTPLLSYRLLYADRNIRGFTLNKINTEIRLLSNMSFLRFNISYEKTPSYDILIEFNPIFNSSKSSKQTNF